MIKISEQLINEMIVHAKEKAPAEACGLLAGKDLSITCLYRMTNIEESNKKYKMDPQEQLQVQKKNREQGLDLLGVYHSHVFSKAYPSETDIKMAYDYSLLYFIASLEFEDPCVKAYMIKNGEITQQEFEVIEA